MNEYIQVNLVPKVTQRAKSSLSIGMFPRGRGGTKERFIRDKAHYGPLTGRHR